MRKVSNKYLHNRGLQQRSKASLNIIFPYATLYVTIPSMLHAVGYHVALVLEGPALWRWRKYALFP